MKTFANNTDEERLRADELRMNGPWPAPTRRASPQQASTSAVSGIVREQDGGALVEIAILLPMLVFTFLAGSDVAMVVQNAIVVQDAALVGARYGATAGHGQDTTGMQTAAKSAATSVSSFKVTSSYFCTCSPGGTHISCTSTCSSLATPAQYEQVGTTASVPYLFAITGLGSTYSMSFTTTLRGTPGGQ